jgi:hypothetical protein
MNGSCLRDYWSGVDSHILQVETVDGRVAIMRFIILSLSWSLRWS